MSSRSLMSNNHTEEIEVIPGAGSFEFGFLVIGCVTVLTLIVMGGVMAKFPSTRNVQVAGGVGVILFALVVAFRGILFGRSELQIGPDRLRIIDELGRVASEVPYALIASIQLVEKTVPEAREPEFFNPLDAQDWAVKLAKESLRGPDVSTLEEQTFLGIRFHDEDPKILDRDELLARARKRSAFQGCDWVLTPDCFQAPLADIKDKIASRWQAYHAAAPSSADAAGCTIHRHLENVDLKEI